MKSGKQRSQCKPVIIQDMNTAASVGSATTTGVFSRMYASIAVILEKLAQNPALCIITAASLLNFVIEAFARHSVFSAFMFIFKNPVACILGIAIIAVTLIPSLFVKRRYAVMFFVMILWLAMGVTDFVVCCFRITPFSAMDISLITSVISIIDVYMSFWGIILIGLLIAGGVTAIVFLFLKMPKFQFNLKKHSLAAVKIAVFFGLAMFTAMQSGSIVGKFSNLSTAYDSYGFTYCFSASIFSRGIARPNGYSQEAVEDIDKQLGVVDSPVAAQKNDPNIIMVQLESYFDLNYMSGVTYSKDPVPNFTKLKSTCPHGSLTVPSIGAGTANTEFEVLTGMNKEYFGIGEYPYKTILQNTACESICYNLKSSGYTSHAIHNHYGTFYDRNRVFANLGFDTFTPVEYMTSVPTTPLGWETDGILPEYIDAALTSTTGRDYVFTISVQAHGKYPTMPVEGYTPTITVTSDVENDAYRYTLEYYASMIHDTDAIIGELVSMYSTYDEPVMLVFYGDHLPNMDLTEEQLSTGELLETEYVIWTNYDLGMEENDMEQDLTSYQLSAYVMELCNKTDGVITKIHQAYRTADNPTDYSYMLYIMEYDMLYGNDYISKQRPAAYEPTDIKLGVSDIKILSAGTRYDEESGQSTVIITGENFTAWSVVYINGNSTRTVFKDSHTLITDDIEISKGDVITVSQVAQNKVVLSTTKNHVVTSKESTHEG